MAFWSRTPKVRSAFLTDVGRARDHNEDAGAVIVPETGADRGFDAALVVCDGVGGHARGEVASAKTVEHVRLALSSPGEGSFGDRLRAAASAADVELRAYAARELEGALVGTTIVVVVVSGRTATIAHAGDSRAYLVRRGEIVALTEDHSIVAAQVKAGLVLASEARQHPLRNRITRAVGLGDAAPLDVSEIPLERGDVLLLCTDGLHGLVEDREIAAAVAKDLERTARRLVDLANERGGTDNVTVALCRVER